MPEHSSNGSYGLDSNDLAGNMLAAGGAITFSTAEAAIRTVAGSVTSVGVLGSGPIDFVMEV